MGNDIKPSKWRTFVPPLGEKGVSMGRRMPIYTAPPGRTIERFECVGDRAIDVYLDDGQCVSVNYEVDNRTPDERAHDFIANGIAYPSGEP